MRCWQGNKLLPILPLFRSAFVGLLHPDARPFTDIPGSRKLQHAHLERGLLEPAIDALQS